ncbi:hypothetical protein Hanom_Chr07g00608801 [Helianthus anomalus]
MGRVSSLCVKMFIQEDFVLLQVSFLAWMAAAALNRRLPTKRKSLKGNSGESANHVLLTCRFARKA